MGNYFQKEIECASPDQIRAWQSERLVKQVKNIYDNVPYYRTRMQNKGLEPGDIKSIDDLHKLPFITKDDLRDAYPYGLLARPLKDCVRMQSTSGTSRTPCCSFLYPARALIYGKTAVPARLLPPAVQKKM